MSTNSLEILIEDFTADASNLMELLKSGKLTPKQWESQFAELIAVYHQAALMLGLGRPDLMPAELAYVAELVDAQLEFLSNFELVVQSQPDFMDAWYSRAESYAKAIKTPYWQGAVDMLPLPAMPAQGTECQNNCGCSWRVDDIDPDNGDFDAYWERSLDDSCPTCIEREKSWNPVRIRDWMLTDG